MKLLISDAHQDLEAAAAKVLAAINAAFDQGSFETASAQWHLIADQLRGKFPKLAELRQQVR